MLVEFWTKKTKSFKNGQVVVAKSPTNPKQTVCKRIAAMEGEIVTVRQSLVVYDRRKPL